MNKIVIVKKAYHCVKHELGGCEPREERIGNKALGRGGQTMVCKVWQRPIHESVLYSLSSDSLLANVIILSMY